MVVKQMADKKLELYLKFRQELDKVCVPDILQMFDTKEITFEGETVGILCASPDYIDCIYILPEYRRKGLAKKAVLEHYLEHRAYDMRLHIIHKNRVAKRFWHSIFDLENVGGNELDGLYRIKGVKKSGKQ